MSINTKAQEKQSPVTLALPSPPNYRGCKPSKSSRQADCDIAGVLLCVFHLFFHCFKYLAKTFHVVLGAGRLFPQLMKGSRLPLAAFEAQTLPSRPRNLLVIYDYLDKWRAERGWGKSPAPPWQRSLPKGGPGSPPRSLTCLQGGLIE